MTAPDSDTPERIRLVVLFGGRSAEHDVSCVSARHVLAAVDPGRCEVEPIGITRDGRWVQVEQARTALEGGDEARFDMSDEFSDGTQATGKRILTSCRAIAKYDAATGRTREYATYLVDQLLPAAERINVRLREARPRARCGSSRSSPGAPWGSQARARARQAAPRGATRSSRLTPRGRASDCRCC